MKVMLRIDTVVESISKPKSKTDFLGGTWIATGPSMYQTMRESPLLDSELMRWFVAIMKEGMQVPAEKIVSPCSHYCNQEDFDSGKSQLLR